MKILLIYHFFHPDTVISSRIFSDLAQSLAQHGHEVTVYTGNRMLRNPASLIPWEMWQNIYIRRFRRPNFNQGSAFGRLINSLYLQLKWLVAFCVERKRYDAVILGTDPQFSYWMFPFMRLMNRHVRLIHWVFDLYPEAILASSPLWMKIPAFFIKPLAKIAYTCVDTLVDIGPCMREKLAIYRCRAQRVTLTPWALAETSPQEPPAEHIRESMFGKAKLGLLYSGTVGYAHDLAPLIRLARQCRASGIDAAFCFSGYGNCFEQQIAQITPEDTNIRIAGFVPESELQQRLAAADIHLVSLRPEWTGIVVPSKFFASLAMGKPVLFSGSEKSAIARWCQNDQVGHHLDDRTTDWLTSLIDHPEEMQLLQQHARKCYIRHFSRESVCRKWRELLLAQSPQQPKA